MAKTKPQSPSTPNTSGPVKLSNKAKNKLQSLFRAQGIEKPDNTLLTSAKSRTWTPKEVAVPVKELNGAKEGQNGSSQTHQKTDHKKKPVAKKGVKDVKPAHAKVIDKSSNGKVNGASNNIKIAAVGNQKTADDSPKGKDIAANTKNPQPPKVTNVKPAVKNNADVDKQSTANAAPKDKGPEVITKKSQPKVVKPPVKVINPPENGHAKDHAQLDVSNKITTAKPPKNVKRLVSTAKTINVAKKSEKLLTKSSSEKAAPNDEANAVVTKVQKVLKTTSNKAKGLTAESTVPKKISAAKPQKNVKRLASTEKTINVQGIVKALKRKLKPSGGFTVESIPSAVESPEAVSVVSNAGKSSKISLQKIARKSANGFTVDDLDNSMKMHSDGSENESGSYDSDCSCSCESQSGEEEEADEECDDEIDDEAEEEEEECDDSDCNCNCSCHSDEEQSDDEEASVGSDAEEIVSNEDDDQMDWSDSYSIDSDESCPQLIPIGAELEESDDYTYETETDYSSSEESYGSSVFSSDDESCPELIPIDAELADSDDATYESEDEYSSEKSYSSHDFSDIPCYDDPMFFETPRDPMIVTVARNATAKWEPIPLIVNVEIYNQENVLDTTIQNIVERSVLPPRQPDRKRSLNVSRVKFVDRLDSIPADAEPVNETIVNETEEVVALSPVPVAEDSTISPDSESPIDFDASNLDESQYEPFDDTAATGDFEQTFEPVEPDVTLTGAHRPHFYNSLNSRQVLLVLKSELHFHGILNVTLLAGNVRIYGYNLGIAQPVRVYSPRGQSFLSMTPAAAVPGSADTPNAAPDLDDVHKLLADLQPDFLNTDIYEAIECFDPAAGNALLLLEAADRQSPAFKMLDRYMRQSIFPNSAAFNIHRSLYSTEFILRTQFHSRPKTKLSINRQWLDVDAAVANAPNARTIVCGGKGVGKSTYVRYLVNRAVQRHGGALLIDLDIGQPELFVPQCIAATCVREPLLGAGYMQSRAPDRALLFGEINVTIAPLKYVRCVLRLLRECASNAEWASVPWIVNTMGYNRGFGLEMMACVLRVFAMTDVVQIQSQRRLDNYERVLNADLVNGFPFKFFRQEVEVSGGGGGHAASRLATHRTHVLRSMARRFGDKTADWDMSAKDSRMATVLANLAPALSDGSEWLTDVRPVCAPLDNLQVLVANETVAAEQVLNLLNGNLVYLCHRHDDADDNVECLGIGIVRGVDHIERMVYLLPAVDRTRLARVNSLAVCNTPLPTSLIQNHSTRVQGRVPYAYNTDDFIGSKQIVRISYRPEHTPRKN